MGIPWGQRAPAQVAAGCRAGFLRSHRLCSGRPSSSSSGKPVWSPSRKTTTPMKPCPADTGERLGGLPHLPFSPPPSPKPHVHIHTCTHTHTHCLCPSVCTDSTGVSLHPWDSRACKACPLPPPSLAPDGTSQTREASRSEGGDPPHRTLAPGHTPASAEISGTSHVLRHHHMSSTSALFQHSNQWAEGPSRGRPTS